MRSPPPPPPPSYSATRRAVGVGFTRTFAAFEDSLDAIPMPEYLKPVPGGLLLGLIGMFLPQVFGVGYPAMSQALGGEFGLGLLLVLVVAKIVVVSLTIGSGNFSGAVRAIAVHRGHASGRAFATAANAALSRALRRQRELAGLVGSAAVFAGGAAP